MNSLFTMLLVLGNSNVDIQNTRVDKALELLNTNDYQDAYLTLAGNRKYDPSQNTEKPKLRGSQSKDMLDYARTKWKSKYDTPFPESKIITENLSTNTVENIVCSENLWGGCDKKPDRTVIVTNQFHVPRVAKIIENLAFDLNSFEFVNATDNGILDWIKQDEIRYFDNIDGDIVASITHCDAIEGQCFV